MLYLAASTHTVLQYVDTRLVLQLCGSSEPTGYPRKHLSYYKTSHWPGGKRVFFKTQEGKSIVALINTNAHKIAQKYLEDSGKEVQQAEEAKAKSPPSAVVDSPEHAPAKPAPEPEVLNIRAASPTRPVEPPACPLLCI